MSEKVVAGIRGIVDPGHVLPDVHLEITEKVYDCWDEEVAEKHVAKVGSEVVGTTTIRVDAKKQEMYLLNPTVNTPGRGFGTALYLAAIEDAEARGWDFLSDHVVSESAMKVWNRFIALGVAEVYKPFVRRESAVNPGKMLYHGRARIRSELIKP